ncbi:MAG: hypothetical protein ABS46_10410 [Cytophagaceae bacterium SCN 52-12]|nr:MAG: hypothetical protein ABS46_10410 [Cytophagaceae bacterium SCN 52-12]
MKKYIIAAGLLTILNTGCQENFLEVIPETQLVSSVFFKTESDFLQAVNAAYVPLRSIFNDRAWKLGEMHSDNTHYARNRLFGAVDNTQNLADFCIPVSNGLTTNDNVLQQYRQDYLIIARTNEILSRIDGVDFDAASKANLKGQTLFLRAFAYFELVRYFGKAPMHLEPVTSREGASKPLSNAEELYAQIKSDLEAAIPLLPAKSKQQAGRATSGAAAMLLANLYMVQKNWSDAEVLLKSIVDSGEYSLMPDYNNAFSETTSNKNNAESIFEVQYMEGSAGLNGNQIYQFIPTPISAQELAPITGTSNPQAISGENNNVPTPDIIAAYESGDKRKDISIGWVTLSASLRADKVYPYIKKYARKHTFHNNTGQNWPVYRYAEVLLFLAEALNEQGKGAQALPYLNQVRRRAGLADATETATGALREIIFKERRVELAFENKRWFDLVRTGRVREFIEPYGQRVKADPVKYYYPDAATVPPSNAFTVLDDYYPLPAVEADLSPNF